MYFRFIFCIAIFLSLLPAAQAQPGVTLGYTNARYLRADTGVTMPLSSSDNLNFGVFYRIGKRAVSVEPTLTYSRKGAVDKHHKVKSYLISESYVQDKLHYLVLSVPVKFRAYLRKNDQDWQLLAGAGPYVALLKKAKARTYSIASGREIHETYKIGNTDADAFKAWDGGVSLSAGIAYYRCALMFQYDLGLSNISSRPEQSIKNRCYSLNLRFAFW